MRNLLYSLAVVAALAPAAAADPADAEPTSSADHVTVPPKRLMLRALFELNLGKDNAGDPFGIAPDIYYGATDKLTLGLVHSSLGTTGLLGGVGSSLCLSGDGCPDVYRNVGIDARYALKTGSLELAANAGLFARSVDPFALALKLGAVGRYRSTPASKLAFEFSPAIFFGLTERGDDGDGTVVVATNKEVLVVPVAAVYSITPAFGLGLQLGLTLPFSDSGDLYALSLALGGSYQLNKQLSLDLAFALPAVAGGDALETGADARSLTFGGSYAF